MANWGADFWGAYSDVAKARMAQAAYAQQQAGMSAFGNAMTDPNIFMPGVPSGGPQAPGQGGGGQAPPNIQNVIGTAAKQYGVDPAFLTREAQIESNFNPSARNANGAAGLFQFMPKTANDMHLRNPMDPAASANAAAELAVQNKGFLTKALGREPTSGELYLAHQQGAGGAAKLLANPNSPAASIVGLKAVTANGGKPNMTAGEFANMWTSKFAAQQAAPVVAQMGQPGQLNWQHIVQAIQAKNPGISPAALAEAVQMFEPLMSQQSQLDWREQSLALREQSMLNQQQLGQERVDQGQQRIEQADQRAAAVQKRFEISQDWKAKGLDERKREFQLKFDQATSKQDKDYALKQMKYFSDQHHQRVLELLGQGNARLGQGVDDDTKKLIDDENARYAQEQQELSSMGQSGGGQQPYQQGDQHPVPKGAVRAPGVDTLGATGAEGGDTPPKSYTGDPALWKYMTPEQRKLWQ